MTKEELELIETLLKNFLGYDVVEDLMLTDDVTRALRAVQRELNRGEQLSFDFGDGK